MSVTESNKYSPRIIVSVISDLVTDQRVHRTCSLLHEQGYRVTLVGRHKHDSLAMPQRGYKTVRLRLWFEKGPWLYVTYNARVFVYLLFHRAELLFANDLDTLLPNFLAAKFFKKALVYDSHEYFTGVPELITRPKVQAVWKVIERYILPHIKYFCTVNASIAQLYEEEYDLKAAVVRNVPLLTANVPAAALPIILPENKKVVLYQGAGINIDRGLEELSKPLSFIEQSILLVIGSGDVIEQLKNQVKAEGLDNKVFFIAKVPFEQLKPLTMLADLGLTLDKDTNINYRYSLPNKLFDYIHAGLPVLASRLTEVEKIVQTYKIGTFIDSHEPRHIADRINSMLADPVQMEQWKTNAGKAAYELCWQQEQTRLLALVHSALDKT